MFLLNRVLWSCVAIGLLLLTYLRFSFATPAINSWWSRFMRRPKVESKIAAETAILSATAISVPQVQRSFGFATWFQQALTLAGASFGKIATHPIGLTLVGAIALASAIFGDQIMTEFGIPLLPTTQQVLDYLTTPVRNINTPLCTSLASLSGMSGIKP
jgi:hypothetical protein